MEKCLVENLTRNNQLVEPGSEFVLLTPHHLLTLPRHLLRPTAWTNVFWEQSGCQQGKHGGGENWLADGKTLKV